MLTAANVALFLSAELVEQFDLLPPRLGPVPTAIPWAR
jgi:hypothetical protein